MLAEHAQFVCENALKLNDAARNLVRVWLPWVPVTFRGLFPRSLKTRTSMRPAPPRQCAFAVAIDNPKFCCRLWVKTELVNRIFLL
jgi:hypothetical protein